MKEEDSALRTNYCDRLPNVTVFACNIPGTTRLAMGNANTKEGAAQGDPKRFSWQGWGETSGPFVWYHRMVNVAALVGRGTFPYMAQNGPVPRRRSYTGRATKAYTGQF